MNGDDPQHNAWMRREPPPRRAGEPPAHPQRPQPHPGQSRYGNPPPPPRQNPARGPQPDRRQPPPGRPGPEPNRRSNPPRNPNAQLPRTPNAQPPRTPDADRRRGPREGAPVQNRATRKLTAADREMAAAATHAPTQRPVPYREGTPPPPSLPPTKRGGGKPPREPRPKRKRHWGRWITALLIVLLILPFAAAFYVENNLVRIDALPGYADRVGDTPGTNWLLVGSDSRAGLTPDQEQELATGGEVGSERTDTIILIHIPKSGSPTLVSLPRDSYVSIPGYGKDKLNSAFSFGGPQLLTQTVEVATGLRIDHYAQIGFSGFADIVDAVGGIDMCLPNAIDDPLAGINLPAGCQHLNGANSLGFVRSRATALADLDRMNNQRLFMAALLKKATSPSTAINPFRAWPLLQGLTKSLKVDEGAHVWDLARLGWALRDNPIATTVPIGGFTDTDVGNVLLWDKDKASQFFEALADDKPIPSELLTTAS